MLPAAILGSGIIADTLTEQRGHKTLSNFQVGGGLQAFGNQGSNLLAWPFLDVCKVRGIDVSKAKRRAIA